MAHANTSMHWIGRLGTAVLLAWGLVAQGPAQALTVGPAVVSSSLGEPLRVEFPLLRISAAESRDLQARLADESAYAAARLERSAELNGLELSLQTRSDGSRVLVLRGQNPVQAPYIDVLIELRWAGGRLLRDLTVLLQANASDKPPSLPPSRLVVQPGDTASDLARNHKDEQISLEQMLLALLKQNPEAFVEDNVNRLKAGTILTLPNASQASQTDLETAREALQQQAEAFDQWRASLGQRVTASDAPDAAVEGTRLPMPLRQQARAGTPQDRLELGKPGSGTEDRIALQRQAQDSAERAAELARNIAELGKLAGAGSSGNEEAKGGIPLPAPTTPSHSRLIDVLSEHPLTPVAAGSLVALLVLMSLWRSRVRGLGANPDPRGLPPLQPLPIEVDLELPRYDTPLPDDAPPAPWTTGQANRHSATPASDTVVPRPPIGMPFDGLSLDLPSHPDQADAPVLQSTSSPLQVRFELAQALWEVGQQHTARALAEEVVEQAHGDLQQQARSWLASRG